MAFSASRTPGAADRSPNQSPELVISTLLAPVVFLPALVRGFAKAVAIALLLTAVILYGLAWSCWTVTARLARRSQALPRRLDDRWAPRGTRLLPASWSTGRRED